MINCSPEQNTVITLRVQVICVWIYWQVFLTLFLIS